MSTKTTFKRIALVAVAALGFGLLSVVPSTASVQSGSGTVLYNYGPSDSPVKPAIEIGAPGVDDGTRFARLVMKDQFYSTTISGVDTITITAVQNVKDSSGNLNSTFPVWQAGGFVNPSNAAGAVDVADSSKITVTSTTAGVASIEALLFFAPQVAGTYVFRLTATSGWTYDWTVVAVAKDRVAVAAKSTSVLAAGNGSPAAAGVDDVVAAPKAADVAAGHQVATARLVIGNAAATNITASSTISATISGPGTLGLGVAATAATALVPTGRAVSLAAADKIGIFSDGTSGVATVTISVGTTVIATETVTFYGAAASISATLNRSTITYATGNVNWYDGNNVTAVIKDANGVTIPSAGFTVTVSNTANGDSWGLGVYGTSAGSVVATVASTETPTVTTTVTTTIVGTPSKATVTFDKDSYYLGEKMKITVSYVDANGKTAGAGVYGSALGSSVSLTADRGSVGGTIISGTANNDDASIAAVAGGHVNLGAATFSAATAPLVPGTVTLSFKDLAGNVITKSVAVIADTTAADTAQAAADAAAEATDAANAATDAANAAAEAADAATAAAQDAADAVAALSAQVADLIAGLKAQLTALTNLVIKIQKKVKA